MSLAVVVMLCATLLARGDIWYVDKDVEGAIENGQTWDTAFKTIQPTIEAAYAAGGGEVWVAEGVYGEQRDAVTGALNMRERVDLYGGFEHGSALRAQRDWDTHVTVIDGSSSLGGAPCQHVVVAASFVTLDGFTFEGATNTGFMVMGEENVILRNCHAVNNQGRRGGAVRIDSSSGIVLDASRFEANFASQEGAGLYVSDSQSLSILGCAFAGNSGGWCGGGLVVNSHEIDIQECEWSSNTGDYKMAGFVVSGGSHFSIHSCSWSDNAGAALMLFGTQGAEVRACGFRRNKDSALFLSSSDDARVVGCLFQDNDAPSGGAVYHASDPYYTVPTVMPLFANCLFIGNRATDDLGYGGAIYSASGACDGKAAVVSETSAERKYTKAELREMTYEGEGEGETTFEGEYGPCYLTGPALVNCTFVGNEACFGGALGGHSGEGYIARMLISNCVFWDNTPNEFGGDFAVPGYQPPMDHSNAQQLYAGEGNISADPQFAYPENGNYRLRHGSPCIDTGRDTRWGEFGGVVDDFDGTARPYDGDDLGAGSTGDGSDYDMGAFEYAGPASLCPGPHAADVDEDWVVSLSELLRVIQFYNADDGVTQVLHCDPSTEDGYALGPGDTLCCPHSSDYWPNDWRINLSELLRAIQFYNSRGYHSCEDGEDGFCPGGAGAAM